MRTILLTVACTLTLGICAFLGARAPAEDATIRIRLVDADGGKDVGGIIRVFPADEHKPIKLPGLFDRLHGLNRNETLDGWCVVPAAGAETTLPRGRFRLEAVSGLETVLTKQEIDLTRGAPKELRIELKYLFRPEKSKLSAGNTHLHLRGMTLDQASEYLRQIPATDGLKVMFISYLERFKDDESYITNRFPAGDLPQFNDTGVLVNNGEEHRHNFEGFGQGYGHVMLLGIKELIKPASVGPGITGGGVDDQPLQVGIENAREQGGTIIWCHNTNGFEDVPNALGDRLDALNVFDGSRTGDFAENYYRYLNIGLRMPISTGTDWFMYDFSRVYAQVDGPVSVPKWLSAVKDGRCVATNGPLLTLTVDGKPIGDVWKLDKPQSVRIQATGQGRHDFQQLQLLRNGKVIHTQPSQEQDGGYRAELVREVRIDSPSWFAVRIESKTKNELDRVLYAHSSPVYVDFAGRQVFDVEAARGLLRQLEESHAEIRARGRFSKPEAMKKVLAIYENATRQLQGRINER